ncbi:MAG: tRNA (adenosine(37)-N6)-threonylcarbamoyltransferase complex transferase subunit TsaD, partial [Candidatus Omnitrophica bacterium]|nr:tRNA (adenosine(37)-N6)-threonylcarbamoyltransferase complex transferase subunit TsaD [Candidatus Omnitrophota bacterium]
NAKNGYSVEKVANAFQESVVNVLVQKTIDACRKKKVTTLLIGGGVAANTCLRSRLLERASAEGIKARFPNVSLCMDNAAMIAGLAYHLL